MYDDISYSFSLIHCYSILSDCVMLCYRKIVGPKQASQVMTSERNSLIRKTASFPGTDIQVSGKDRRKEMHQIYLTVSLKTISHQQLFISWKYNIIYFCRSDPVCCWCSNEYWLCLISWRCLRHANTIKEKIINNLTKLDQPWVAPLLIQYSHIYLCVL